MLPKAAPPGPASPPTGNPGLAATAMAKVREAIRILEKALPELPVGSPQHESCVKAITGLSKAYPTSDEMPGIQNSTLMGLQRDAKEGAQMRQLQQMMGAGGGGAPGGAPPGLPGMAPGGPPGM